MRTYWLAARPYSLTASVVPVLLGAALAKLTIPALALNGRFWLDFVLVLIGCLTVQAVSNVVNDLADFKSGLDSRENSSRYKALVAGDLSWRQMLGFALVLCAVSGLIGLYFMVTAGGWIVGIVILGGVLAIEYTAPPLKLKYRALGDLGVLLAFGLGMLFGVYFALGTGHAEVFQPLNLGIVLAYGLPSALLVVAILHANNHRDREADRSAGAKTLANSLTFESSKRLLVALVTWPFALTVLVAIGSLWIFGPIGLSPLAVLITLPALLGLLGPIRQDQHQKTVPSVARLHGQFGVMMAAAVAAEAAFRMRS